jgi:predicted regulator of Ras-like GTPase activity (Roadblock/LC7/MglB family)
MASNDNLRRDRIVFYARDIDKLDAELDGFLELSGARCSLLIDRDGHLVTRRGEADAQSLESVCALVAGSFAATKEMARLLGEEQFTTMFHQGQRDSIQISLVGARALFAAVFDERTNLGLVRFYSQEATRHLEQILTSLDGRDTDGETDQLSVDFSASAAAALDSLF